MSAGHRESSYVHAVVRWLQRVSQAFHREAVPHRIASSSAASSQVRTDALVLTTPPRSDAVRVPVPWLPWANNGDRGYLCGSDKCLLLVAKLPRAGACSRVLGCRLTDPRSGAAWDMARLRARELSSVLAG